ncbi:hypothetical protein SteCoe_3408 [Stentor coeruleus]|uniref:AB hydrolase-1 domain-containing protein n=1 Tax=Stentor coeruleus TaxID=5963 RepID=A0A1R2CX73_9CILI|nr:hypothetical protein SteCoe_3408 [Stentor coeruleus]
MLNSALSWIYNLFVMFSIFVILIAVVLYFYQDKMIYQPNPVMINLPTPDLNPEGYRNPGERGIPYQDEFIQTSDGFRIHAWFMKRPEQDAATIIYFHGNAGNLGFRLDIYETLYKTVKTNVLAVSYRGYGYSEGKPNEIGLNLDSEAVMKHIFDSSVNKNKIFVFGASLGGAVAIYVAQKFPNIRGIMIENTFTSLPELVDHLMPKIAWMKSLILRNYWPSIQRLPFVNCKILFIAGVKDELIPHAHMLELYKIAKDEQKEIFLIQDGDHNMSWKIAGPEFSVRVESFIKRSLE